MNLFNKLLPIFAVFATLFLLTSVISCGKYTESLMAMGWPENSNPDNPDKPPVVPPVVDPDSTLVKYKVLHMFQSLADSSDYVVDSEDELEGYAGQLTAAKEISKYGFESIPVTQQTIDADGSTVVQIKYNRKLFNWTFNAGTGYFTTTSDSSITISKLYQTYFQSNMITEPEMDDSVFVEWLPTLPNKFEQDNIFNPHFEKEMESLYCLGYQRPAEKIDNFDWQSYSEYGLNQKGKYYSFITDNKLLVCYFDGAYYSRTGERFDENTIYPVEDLPKFIRVPEKYLKKGRKIHISFDVKINVLTKDDNGVNKPDIGIYLQEGDSVIQLGRIIPPSFSTTWNNNFDSITLNDFVCTKDYKNFEIFFVDHNTIENHNNFFLRNVEIEVVK